MSNTDSYGTFLRLFRGREDYFAEQGRDFYRPVHKTLDDFYVDQHLAGNATFGIYLLTSGSSCNLMCIDIDIPKSDLNDIDFKDSTKKYAHLGDRLNKIADVLHRILGVPAEATLYEETGGRGYHVWVFLDGELAGDDAVAFGEVLKDELGFDIEFFPKQGKISDRLRFGNLIKLPLGVHKRYGSRSVFFLLNSGQLVLIDGLSENLKHLSNVIPLKPEIISAVVKARHKEPIVVTYADEVRHDAELRRVYDGDPTTLKTRCAAMGGLRTKAERGERLSRSEAFHFTNVFLSMSLGRDYIIDTLRKSYGAEFSPERTVDEITKIYQLHPTACVTLFNQGICPKYCREGVRNRNEDPLLPSTTPCSVWLHGTRPHNPPVSGNLLPRIGDTANIVNAYHKLRAYHEDEDTLFFDVFDYERFERSMYANCEVMSAALREDVSIPLAGYIPVKVPKKLNAQYGLEYRTLAYSSVYDQVPIQAVFNIVGPTIEDVFQKSSYGYRWNTDTKNTLRIFEDWRESYPRFRGNIFGALRANPSGFYICCDIKGFYDHIDQKILCEQLRPLVKDNSVFQFVKKVVEMYQSSKGSGKGVPQGPAYARLLANLYLNDFDSSASKITPTYFRYVDDMFLFFATEAEAKRGLDSIVRLLGELGLELSQDENKTATVMKNTDESRIQRSLEKIQYGILEGTRHIRHLDTTKASDFYDAVQREHGSPTSLDELLRLNESIPSLLYVVTQELLIAHPLRAKLFAIIKLLVKRHWFYPKRLKYILHKLLNLELVTDDYLMELFEDMEPVHRAYLLLSVCGVWRGSQKRRALLERIIEKGICDKDEFVRGFAIATAFELGLSAKYQTTAVAYIQSLGNYRTSFLMTKWLGTINYMSLMPDERAAVRDLLTPESDGVLKGILLSNISGNISAYLDIKYLSNLIEDAHVLLISPACSLITEITDNSDWFKKLLVLLGGDPRLKAPVVMLLAKNVFDKRAKAGMAEVQNLKALYETVQDLEIKRTLLNALSRIETYGAPDTGGFSRIHQQISNYNECFLFKCIDSKANYDFVEVIPLSRLCHYIHGNVGEIKKLLCDLADKLVLPPLNFIFDSGRQEIYLQFNCGTQLKPIAVSDFSLSAESILRALRLAAQVYKKACYFKRVIGKSPLVDIENVLVDEKWESIAFKTFGRCLESPYVMHGTAVSDEDQDLPKMIGILLVDLLFKSQDVADRYVKDEHAGVEAFLARLIRNLKGKDSRQRYSYSRFQYIVAALAEATAKSNLHIDILYLREGMKGELFNQSAEHATWINVCRAVSGHVRHIRQIYNKRVLRALPYSNQLLFTRRSEKSLHQVSKELVNLILNVQKSFKEAAPCVELGYVALMESLLYFASICLETVCLERGWTEDIKRKQFPFDKLPTSGEIRVRAAGYEQVYESAEFAAAINSRYGYEEPCCLNLSLKQVGLRTLFASDASLIGNNVAISGNNKLSESTFRALAHACLIRIPAIEAKMLQIVMNVCDSLQQGEDYGLLDCKTSFNSDVSILAADFAAIRKHSKVTRSSGVGDGRYFPPDITCAGLFESVTAEAWTLPSIPFTSKFPVSKHKCSWDSCGDKVVTLVVPDDGFSSLLDDLQSGKFFGRRWSYLYSGRGALVWDSVTFLFLILVSYSCGYGGNALTSNAVKTWCGIGSGFAGTAALAVFVKIVFRDLKVWSPSWGLLLNQFRDNPEGVS